MSMDYEAMSRKELRDTTDAAKAELAKRQTEDVFRSQLADMQDQYVSVFGDPHEPEEVWSEQPYQMTAYRIGDTVAYEGGYYRSLLPANQFQPDGRGWRRYNKDGSPRSWSRPDYDHDGYMKGERVTWGGDTYECTADHVLSDPAKTPEEWDLLGDES